MLCEGRKIIHRVSIAVMQQSEGEADAIRQSAKPLGECRSLAASHCELALPASAAAQLMAAKTLEGVMAALREVPRLLDVDAMMDAAFALSLSADAVAALEREYDELMAASLETCGPLAGKGVRAHVAASEAAKKRRAAR